MIRKPFMPKESKDWPRREEILDLPINEVKLTIRGVGGGTGEPIPGFLPQPQSAPPDYLRLATAFGLDPHGYRDSHVDCGIQFRQILDHVELPGFIRQLEEAGLTFAKGEYYQSGDLLINTMLFLAADAADSAPRPEIPEEAKTILTQVFSRITVWLNLVMDPTNTYSNGWKWRNSWNINLTLPKKVGEANYRVGFQLCFDPQGLMYTCL